MTTIVRAVTVALLVAALASVAGVDPPSMASGGSPAETTRSARSVGTASTEIWAACGRSSPEDKVVRVFPRTPPVPGPRTTATLLCGNDRHGYRHIANSHGIDWQNIAFYTGENWRFLTDFAIEQILTVPEPGYPVYRKDNDTWTYRAPLEIRDSDGNVRATYHPIVSVAARDGKIITAFPSR